MRAKVASCKDAEARATMAARILEGLRGAPFKVAKRVGLKEICEEGGLDALIAAIRTEALPLAAQEARELYRKGSLNHGILTRQRGEPMIEYIRRQET